MGNRKADCGCQTVNRTLQNRVILLYVDECHTEYRAVCCNQRKVNAERSYRDGIVFFRNISTSCTSAAMTRMENDRFQIIKFCRCQDKFVNQTCHK